MTEQPTQTPDVVVPAWEAFHRDYVDTGIPCLVVVRPAPFVALFLNEGSASLGGRFEVSSTAILPVSPLDEVRLSEVSWDGRPCLELSTASPELYRNFFFMLADIASGIVSDGEDPIASLDRSLRNWNALLRHPETLSEERQIGLFGELWLLRRLVGSIGVEAIAAWTGPRRQAHDFRMPGFELEVKTTSAAGRLHTINGLDQLVPSTGLDLYILSLQITLGGAGGITLAEAAEQVATGVRQNSLAEKEFFELLALSGFASDDWLRYPRRRRLRGPPMLVAVRDGCPRLTPNAIAALPAGFAATRVRDVTYRVDLSDMGVAETHPVFMALLASSNVIRRS